MCTAPLAYVTHVPFQLICLLQVIRLQECSWPALGRHPRTFRLSLFASQLINSFPSTYHTTHSTHHQPIMYLASSILLPLIALPLSIAKTIPIGVGEGGLVFNPSSVTADIGDVLQFHFYPRNHSVVQGSFSSPCQPLAGGVYSGFVVVAAGEAVSPHQTIVINTKRARTQDSQACRIVFSKSL